jgi:peptide chain release factor 2
LEAPQTSAEDISKLIKELHDIEGKYLIYKDWDKKYKELEEFKELAKEDKTLKEELDKEEEELSKEIEREGKKFLLTGEYVEANAILSIHPGAGGKESCDWASMLLRMYLRWAEKNSFSSQILDILPEEGAGIKSVDVLIKGDYAYGYLRGEIGVHRLVRISPFDANRRRHTSFAAVYVLPEVPPIDIKLREEDLKIETFRASGPGGQHVNVTDSAVRITHLPTKIVATSQSDRSQRRNKEQALKVLCARLYQFYKDAKEKELASMTGDKVSISWGNRIRSYILYPYKLVKDHRTNFESNNPELVLDGDINPFIEKYIWS